MLATKGFGVTPILNIVEAIAAISTAIGVLFVWQQVRLSKDQLIEQRDQQVTLFEDELTREYREIIKDIPVKALLGEVLTEEEHRETLGDFYRYVDLSNTQIFLHDKERIRETTWQDWEAGIESHFRRPAFKRAWDEIKSAKAISDDFQELRDMEESWKE